MVWITAAEAAFAPGESTYGISFGRRELVPELQELSSEHHEEIKKLKGERRGGVPEEEADEGARGELVRAGLAVRNAADGVGVVFVRADGEDPAEFVGRGSGVVGGVEVAAFGDVAAKVGSAGVLGEDSAEGLKLQSRGVAGGVVQPPQREIVGGGRH